MKRFSYPCQSFERLRRYGLGSVELLTVIRVSEKGFPFPGQESIVTHQGRALPTELQRPTIFQRYCARLSANGSGGKKKASTPIIRGRDMLHDKCCGPKTEHPTGAHASRRHPQMPSVPQERSSSDASSCHAAAEQE